MSFSKATSRTTIAFVLFVTQYGPTALAQGSGSVDAKELMGSWVAIRIIAMAPVTALTSRESKALVGRKVNYSPSSFRSGGVSSPVKGYTRRTLTEDDFLTQNKLPLAKLGVAVPRVVEIAVDGADGSVADQFGAWVYPVSKDVNVVAFKGVYFELKRVVSSK
jgi:hypothetical protein